MSTELGNISLVPRVSTELWWIGGWVRPLFFVMGTNVNCTPWAECMSDLCMFGQVHVQLSTVIIECSRLQQGSYTGYFAFCTVSEDTSLLRLCKY